MNDGAVYRAGRRALDVVGSGLGLVVLAPLLCAIAVAVRLDSPGPALFRHRRVGLYGQHFNLLKFRTMTDGAERLSRETLGTDDPRITPLGHHLRRLKIDELPQLINVLKGDMSLVGPRPEIPHYTNRYTDADRIVLSVRPGITDPSSIELSNLDAIMESRGDEPAADFYSRVILPKKLALQKAYIANRSLPGDIGIILRTVLKIMAPR
ncbi:MAG: sugar transferase [Gammaproteobacteria bacterium]|nr:sugar transferase [Gammaproteobacteria bacterium]